MIVPILSYGHSILNSPCLPVTSGETGLQDLVQDMWETMYNARGCGLAAPQVNKSLQLFIVDSKLAFDAMKPGEREYLFGEGDTGIIETFMNAKIIENSVETWENEEGCLSIPNLTRPVTRPVSITIEYTDANFSLQLKTFSGITARMVQHEYDHTCGRLFIDYLGRVARKLLNPRLRKISKGLLPAKYPMQYRSAE